METIKNAAKSVSESFQENTAAAEKEKNKEVAKGNTGASLGERASAAVDAVGNKMDESKHSAKSEGHKEAAKN